MPPPSRPDAVRRALTAARLGLTPIEGVVGFGVPGDGGEVFLCRFHGGTIDVTARTDPGAPSDILIMLARSGWSEIAGCDPSAVARTIHQARPAITGHLPYFIRHLHGLVDAMRAVAPVLAE